MASYGRALAGTSANIQSRINPDVNWKEDVSSVLKFGGLLINLLEVSQAPQLVEPLPVGPLSAGVGALLTIRVANVDAVCAALREIGVDLLNGPIDRPWGRRTASFADPSGHVWVIGRT